MKRKFACTGACLCLLAFTFSFALSAEGQSAAVSTAPTGPLSYDATKEVTLDATVQSVITKRSAGMIWGSHIMIETKSGVVDASLARLPLAGKNAVTFAPGEAVEITGVLKTLHGQPVLLARLIKAESHTYTLRNMHGIPVAQTRRAHSAVAPSQGGAQ